MSTTINTINTITDFFSDFLLESGATEEVVEKWNSPENQAGLSSMIKSIPTQKKKVSKKDPKKPKKNKSGYLFFCEQMRPKIKKRVKENNEDVNGKMLSNLVMKELGKAWSDAKEGSEIDVYVKMATEDKLRYVEEMKSYNPSEGFESPKAVKKKDTTKPKRGKSAWLFFCQKTRPELKKEGLGASYVREKLSAMWAEMKEENGDELKEYTKLASEDKVRYENEKEESSDNSDSDEEVKMEVESDLEVNTDESGEEVEMDIEEKKTKKRRRRTEQRM
jgi:hypothetical protein